MKRGYSIALKDRIVTTRPYVPMLAEAAPRAGFLEYGQFEAVLAHLPSELRPVITFAYWSGWRINSEILSLQWRMVDLDRGVVKLDIGSTKNGEGRTFPFGDILPQIRQVFEDQRVVADELARAGVISPWVFNRGGKRIRDFRGAWRTACRKAGVPGRIPHDLRRGAVRNLERAGVPRSVAMEITGHKTESVYLRYDIVDEGDLADGLAKLASYGHNLGHNRGSKTTVSTGRMA